MVIAVPAHLSPFLVLGKKTMLQRQMCSASFCYLTQAVGKLGPASLRSHVLSLPCRLSQSPLLSRSESMSEGYSITF